MAEYIEREAAIEAIYDAFPECRTKAMAASALSDIHAADVQPVRHGRWYRFQKVYIDPQTGIGIGRDMYKCDACNVGEEETRKPYCPKCGAKMDGDNG